MREGRLTSSSDDRRFDFDREDKNPPSNGQLRKSYSASNIGTVDVDVLVHVALLYLYSAYLEGYGCSIR